MKRSVIQIGNSTQLVSLPRQWSIRNCIKKGDEIEVEEKNNALILRADRKEEVKQVTIDLRDMPTLKRRTICAAYLKGYDEVKILYNSPEYIRIIQQILPEFTGYDIVMQDKKGCVIKEISKPTQGEFNNLFNRLFLVVYDMASTLVEGLSHNDKDLVNSIQFRETSVNKFSNFCRRIINRYGYPQTENISNVYFILFNLELLGDEYKALSLHLKDQKKVPQSVIDTIRAVNSFFSQVHLLFGSFSKEKAITNAKQFNELSAQIDIKSKKDDWDLKTYYFIRHCSQIGIYIQEAIYQIHL